MSKQAPSSYVIITTHREYILPLQLLTGLTYLPMRIYPIEERKLLSHVVLTPNIDWNPNFLNFTQDKYAKYNKRLEDIG